MKKLILITFSLILISLSTFAETFEKTDDKIYMTKKQEVKLKDYEAEKEWLEAELASIQARLNKCNYIIAAIKELEK